MRASMGVRVGVAPQKHVRVPPARSASEATKKLYGNLVIMGNILEQPEL
jgi:hypothetical protein